MTPNTVLIIAGDTRWHVGLVDGPSIHVEGVVLPEDGSAKQIAEMIAARVSRPDNLVTSLQSADKSETTVKRIPGAGAGVVLGVPSGWCLCGTVTVPELGPRQKRTAMLFALEEKLPIPAEEVVADFIVTDKAALGIAVEIRRLRELVDALEDRGIAVEAICPTALLAIQHLSSTDEHSEPMIAWRDPEGLNLFDLKPEHLLKHWRWMPNTGEAGDHSDQKSELSETEIQWLTQYLGNDEQPHLVNDAGLLEAACHIAAEIQAGRTEPWVNLRRDAMDVSDRFRRVRGHLVTMMAAAAVLLLAVTGTCIWRAHAYQQADQRYVAAVTELYHDTFGDQPRPTSVKRRFNTRLRELRGLRGEEVDDTSDLETTNALWMLHDMLKGLPTDKRLCLLDVTVEHDHLTIVGQTRSHSDADLIAAALRRGGRFEVQPPSTSNLKDGGVTFTLNCTAVEKTPSTPPEPSTIAEIVGATAQGHTVLDRSLKP